MFKVETQQISIPANSSVKVVDADLSRSLLIFQDTSGSSRNFFVGDSTVSDTNGFVLPIEAGQSGSTTYLTNAVLEFTENAATPEFWVYNSSSSAQTLQVILVKLD